MPSPAYGEVYQAMDENRLRIKATIVDTVSRVSKGKTGGNNRQMWLAWNDWLEECGSLDHTLRRFRHPEEPNTQYKYWTEEPMQLVFWKIMLCDVNNELKDGNELRLWHDWFCRELRMNLLLWDSRLLAGRDDEESQIGEVTVSVGLVRNRTRHKVLFDTEKFFTGLGPSGIREGDVIAFFSGYNVPFILRPQAGSGDIQTNDRSTPPNSGPLLRSRVDEWRAVEVG